MGKEHSAAKPQPKRTQLRGAKDSEFFLSVCQPEFLNQVCSRVASAPRSGFEHRVLSEGATRAEARDYIPAPRDYPQSRIKLSRRKRNRAAAKSARSMAKRAAAAMISVRIRLLPANDRISCIRHS